MLIQCPSCHARAKIPDSKEGAKVRCGECGRVYVAAAPGSGGRVSRSSSSSGAIIGIGVGAAALLAVAFLYNSGGGEPPQETQAQEEPEEEVVVDSTGFQSELVQLAVQIHTAAHAFDEDRVMRLLHGPKAWEREQAALVEEGADGTGAPTADEFTLAPSHERNEFLREKARGMVEGDEKDLVGDWKPHDGMVIEESDDEAVIRVAVQRYDDDSLSFEERVEERWVEWKLAKEAGRWKAWSWERWYSPDERKAARKKRGRGYEKVTLSDGSVVLEREPEPLGHLGDTPQDVRDRIDKAYATMIDLDLTSEGINARREIEAIGRPAIPILLTGLYEIPLDTEEQGIQVNTIVVALRTITGQYFGYKPTELVGSGVGTSKERRESSIKQWFAWWYRNEKKFTEKEVVDGLEGKIELTDREKRLLERDG